MKKKEVKLSSRRQFAVDLAKDVIKQIKRKKFVAESGIYCGINFPNYGNTVVDPVDSLDSLIAKENSTCSVCAMGSLIAAYAIKKDNTTVAQACHPERIADKLAPYFSKKQLTMMESVFEGFIYDDGESAGDNLYQKGSGLGTPLSQREMKATFRMQNRLIDKKDEDKLIAIMRNIVKNDGKFVPAGL